jgi:hypothetical protein
MGRSTINLDPYQNPSQPVAVGLASALASILQGLGQRKQLERQSQNDLWMHDRQDRQDQLANEDRRDRIQLDQQRAGNQAVALQAHEDDRNEEDARREINWMNQSDLGHAKIDAGTARAAASHQPRAMSDAQLHRQATINAKAAAGKEAPSIEAIDTEFKRLKAQNNGEAPPAGPSTPPPNPAIGSADEKAQLDKAMADPNVQSWLEKTFDHKGPIGAPGDTIGGPAGAVTSILDSTPPAAPAAGGGAMPDPWMGAVTGAVTGGNNAAAEDDIDQAGAPEADADVPGAPPAVAAALRGHDPSTKAAYQRILAAGNPQAIQEAHRRILATAKIK